MESEFDKINSFTSYLWVGLMEFRLFLSVLSTYRQQVLFMGNTSNIMIDIMMIIVHHPDI